MESPTKIQEMSTEQLRYECENAHLAFVNIKEPIKKENLVEGTILWQMFTELELRDSQCKSL